MSVNAANTTPLQPEPQSFLIEGKRLTKERKFIIQNPKGKTEVSKKMDNLSNAGKGFDRFHTASIKHRVKTPKQILSNTEFKKLWKNKNEQPLGKGGFGTVYETQSTNGKKYVIKVFKSTVDQETINKEIEGNVVLFSGTNKFDSQFFYKQGVGFLTTFHGKFEINDQQVLVYEKAEGKDFQKFLYTEKPCRENPSPPCIPCTKENIKDRCLILAQMGHAIAISHEAGVVNRDIKPENLMVHVSDDPDYEENKLVQAKMIDLGTAYDLKNPKENDAKQIAIGTLLYMPPEMLKRDVEKSGISPAADVYSYGISIIESFIGGTSNGFWQDQIISKGPIGIQKTRLAGTLFNNLSKPNFLIDQRDDQKIPDFYSDQQCNFLQGLLRDCLNPDPEKRPSAAQVAELLQLFSSSLEDNDGSGEITSYSEAKKIVEKDRPKAIPIAIRDMIFSKDKEISKQGLNALDSLVKADPSYINTPSYGLIKIKEGEESYKSWRNDHPEAAKNLKDWTYVDGQTPDTNQSIPVSEKVYNVIHAGKS